MGKEADEEAKVAFADDTIYEEPVQAYDLIALISRKIRRTNGSKVSNNKFKLIKTTKNMTPRQYLKNTTDH